MDSIHAKRVNNALQTGLEILSDDEPGTNEASDDAAIMLEVVNRIGVLRAIKALRDAADCAKDAALGGEQGNNLFNGLAEDDLLYIGHAFERAITACGGEV